MSLKKRIQTQLYDSIEPFICKEQRHFLTNDKSGKKYWKDFSWAKYFIFFQHSSMLNTLIEDNGDVHLLDEPCFDRSK